MNTQLKAPLYQAIVHHIGKKTTSFHVPGHKNGSVFPEMAEEDFQRFLKYDLTEVSGLDDLHSPEGAILEAEMLLAALYQVKKSFFLINGSTVGNLAMIMATCREDSPVLVQRNCHKSVLNAIRLAKARPVFLEPEYNKEWMVAGGVSLETVQRAIEQFPDASAVVLTYPNYYGMVNGLQSIIQMTHLHNIPVLVDEAHGPHFILGEPFPVSAVELGADVVVQSAHKTLPAMTMGSYLHVNSQLLNVEKISDYLHMLQSSSPSYPIMASLDLARFYLASYTRGDMDYLLNCISEFKRGISTIPGVKVLEDSLNDPLKVVIQSTCELNGFELQKQLEQAGVYTELADPHNVLLVIPLLKEKQFYPFTDTLLKIKQVVKDTLFEKEEEIVYVSSEKISELAIPYKEMANYQTAVVPLDEAAGHVCAESIIPYPPGIPLLLAGERISIEKIHYLEKLTSQGARFQGSSTLEAGLIKVFLEV